jgi:hypothetical protein
MFADQSAKAADPKDDIVSRIDPAALVGKHGIQRYITRTISI